MIYQNATASGGFGATRTATISVGTCPDCGRVIEQAAHRCDSWDMYINATNNATEAVKELNAELNTKREQSRRDTQEKRKELRSKRNPKPGAGRV